MSTKTETEKPKNSVTLTKCVLSYPHLTELHTASEGGTARYGAELRLPKSDTEGYGKIKKIIDSIKKDKEKGKVKIYDSGISIKDGDTWEKRKPEHAGFWIISANRAEKQKRIPCVGKKKANGFLTKDEVDDLFYPGCLVNAIIGVFYSDKGGSKICFSLDLLQFAGDGERLGGGSEASLDDLPDLDDDEDDGLEEDDGL